MSTQLIKNELRVDTAKTFVDSVNLENPYYIFASHPGPVTTIVDTPVDSKFSDVDTYNNMLFGKRVKSSDIVLCTKRYEWNQNTVYDMYDDVDSLADKAFYVSVDTGLELRVYKCLFNNNGGPSTTEPFGTSTDTFETLPDGYIWKYMYTISKLESNRFATDDFIPVYSDDAVVAAAKPGTIDVIKVDKVGANYRNYLNGTFVLSNDLRVNGNPLVYAIPNGEPVDNFYVNCLIKIVSTGEYRLIVGYIIENGRKLITIDRPFDAPPIPSDQFEISPNVFVRDTSNTATIECYARAIVNSQFGNTISIIEVLNPGLNYRTAYAEILPHPSVGVTSLQEVEIRPIISPDEGHGAKPDFELQAKFVCVSGVFNGNSGPLIANNTYKTFGLLKNPLFSNCTLLLDSSTIKGAFLENENIYRYKSIKLAGKVQLFANSLVIGSNTSLVDSLRENDKVLITTGNQTIISNAQGINVISYANNSVESFTLSSNATFAQSNCDIYLVQDKYFAKCVAYDTDTLQLTNVDPVGFEISSYVYGEISNATAKMFAYGANVANATSTYLTIGDRAFNDFNEFSQLTRLEGYRENTLSWFVPNEELVQASNTGNDATAAFHSYESVSGPANDYLYVSNVINTLNAPGTISSNRTDGVQTRFQIINKYDGELVRDSGEFLYIENINSITRNVDQTEVIKLILEF